ncbi:MAG TPA: hypothetical protein VF291_03160 [Burkholderiaceae bacterium]
MNAISTQTAASTATATEAVFRLPAQLTVAACAQLRADLLAHLGDDVLVLDGGGVDTVGAAGLQLLAALVRSRGPGQTRWQSLSTTLIRGARLAGLQQALALAGTAGGAP